jgi:type 2 lantibiotic biosynthesis protein LanM
VADALRFLDGPEPLATNGRSPPAWAQTLVRTLATARSERGRAASYRFCDAIDPLPFEEIIAPFVVAASERLPGTVDDLLTEEALSQLERFLLGRLTSLSSRALQLEFTIERHARLSPLGRLLVRGENVPSRSLYSQFVERMQAGALADFFREYPVLARLLSRVTDLWVEATSEFIERLARDRDELRRVFGAAGGVTALEPGLSDPHRGGRTVIGVSFASGTKVVYKPKDLGTEVAYNRLLAWLNDRGAPLEFRVLELIDRSGYGWVEWVAHAPCRDAEELRQYYRRAGMLVCLVYALAGTDCHRENVIASGEHPVLVDVETLMHHRLHAERPVRAWSLALDQLTGGVLGTGLLPSWQAEESGDRPASDISALHTVEEDELVEHQQKWEHINSDGMVLTPGAIPRPIPKNQPLLGVGRPRLEEHGDDVLEGFQAMYSFLLERRGDLLKPDNPLGDLLRQRVRFIFRNTRVYGALHNELRDPIQLRDGIDRSIQLERLGRAASPDGELDARWWPLIEAEKDAMEDVDVPLFTAPADGVTLTVAPGRDVDGCLREPSAERVVERLRALGPDDLDRQLGFVAGSLHSHAARHEAGSGRRLRRAGTRRRVTDLEPAAVEIAAEIADRAIRAPGDDGAVWIAPHYRPRLERYQLQPIGMDLHSGACGIALFLAAVERVMGGGDYGRLALAALEPVHEALAEGSDALADAVGLGAATGLGSVVYALTRISQLLEKPDLLDAAAGAAAALSDERIADAKPDVFAGLAGEILGQLALYEAVEDPRCLERAAMCARRLLATRVGGPARGRAWITFENRVLTGFAHGAAGIAYALSRLSAALGDSVYRSAAEEAIAYEDQLFQPELDNWPDLREEEPTYKANWCHGAPGIGLARLGGLCAIDTDAVRRDIDAAVRTTLRTDVDFPDHLCCGNLGRVDLLLVAGERLERPALPKRALERARVIAGRAQTMGGFSLHSSLPGRVHMPSFFMGMSGIGYELLRAAHPQILPSVLLWE